MVMLKEEVSSFYCLFFLNSCLNSFSILFLGALSAVAKTNSPILFIGVGEGFEDFEIFRAQSFVSRMLGMGDIGGLMRDLGDIINEDEQKNMIDKLQKGQFTLNDFKSQLEMIMSLGPINKVMEMIPGIPPAMVEMMKGSDGNNRLNKFIVIIDSMTSAENDCRVDIISSDSRIRRIARGSGAYEAEVKMLLMMHKQFGQLAKQMGKSGMLNDKNMQQEMQRNPQGMIDKMAGMLDPRMMQQIGGKGNLMNIMNQMMGPGGGGPGGGGGGMGGGMPDLSAIMGGMGGMPPGGGGMFPPGMEEMMKNMK